VTRETNKILCVFRPSNNGPEEVYAGAFQTIASQELSPDRAMIWVVKASPATQRSTGLCNNFTHGPVGTATASTSPDWRNK